ncbi:MAG TPA: hypothetical protein VF194_09210 [Ferrovibrio sp.]|jgi:hypothetical protein|uniref:hypothetical protein n=1 Tax=Ferrovibrio sp. TaxID=1917215 RepID=UPI002ED1F175
MYHSQAVFGLLELPFLFIAVIFAFRVATKLKGGAFGTGMQMLAWGFVVMAVGHLHMQIQHFTGINLFGSIFGEPGGDVVWVLALAATWGLSAYGFHQIYKAAKGG